MRATQPALDRHGRRVARLALHSGSSDGSASRVTRSTSCSGPPDPSVVEAFLLVVDDPADESAPDAEHAAATHVRTLLEAPAV
jgi:hypothetical protein